ncbi:Fructosamine kinase-domain-containing protein [Tricharina praecox]|uniref:Fructosamine kinase-domain-containing protein n=1 Tax=Tricharina praecox TaxID=43433 RepID=UPI00221E50DB|nr:Fructosamine kinase-domain-containing protein [Tricharina praecox]KAI5849863.1 Fructosamine kinase-domain-containing protein [Tricharina praecox]
MMRGEYESLSAIHSVVPTFCPRPISWGAFKTKPNTYYSLCVYHERTSGPSDAAAFCSMLARLHVRSRAPDNRFGFPVATFFGEVLNEKMACESWEECFTACLRHMLALDEEINGVDDTLVALREELIARVVPRLLRPLESGGRRIKPALIHGDLCAANAGAADSADGVGSNAMVWRPAALFAHNEFELGHWRAVRNGFDSRFLRAYLKLVPISEPKQDFEDRNALYALRYVIACSIRYPGSAKYRQAIVEEMGSLVGRFSPGPEIGLSPGYVEEKEQEGRDEAAVFASPGVHSMKVVRSNSTTTRGKHNYKPPIGGKLVKR